MKKCPYCAEKIQNEAVICRYCGRDLPPLPRKTTPAKSSIWKQAAKASGVLTVLGIISVLLTRPPGIELVGTIFYGTIPNFLLWWAVCAFVIWLFRKYKNWAILIIVGLIILICGGALAVETYFSTQEVINLFANLTPTPKPTMTPRPTATLVPAWWSDCIDGQAISPEAFDQYIGRTLCVFGTLTKISRIEGAGIVYDIFPPNTGIPFFIFADFSQDNSDSPLVGDCLVVEGTGYRTEENVALIIVNRMVRSNVDLPAPRGISSLPKCK